MASSYIFLALLYLCCSSSSINTGHIYIEKYKKCSPPAKQTCPNGYYCPNGGECVCRCPRSDRCTPRQNCTGLDECYKQPNGSYLIRIGYVDTDIIFNHRFLIYRGFAYEFGPSYSTQVLDITDPRYKYKELDVTITVAGTSYCTYDEALLFVNKWNPCYNFICNNCWIFANRMSHYLKTSSCSIPGDRNVTMLMQEIDNILMYYTLAGNNECHGCHY